MSRPSGIYIGPLEIWRRFMAGLTVTHDNTFEDGSEWVIRPMPRYHLKRLSLELSQSTERS